MDPFIESQAWETFHHALIAVLLESLTPRVRPRYVVRVDERVYVEHEPNGHSDVFRPDVSVLERQGRETATGDSPAAASSAAAQAVVLTLPMPERVREAFLTIRSGETMEVITIIEVLSPGNKRPGGDGRREYLSKREAVRQSATHLVELDLLRRGERLPTLETLPRADYYAFVCRGMRRPRVEVYRWSLGERLLTIPVPLAGDDPDVALDLQSVVDTVYDRAGYDYALDYGRPPEPPPSESDAVWVRQRLDAAARRSPTPRS